MVLPQPGKTITFSWCEGTISYLILIKHLHFVSWLLSIKGWGLLSIASWFAEVEEMLMRMWHSARISFFLGRNHHVHFPPTVKEVKTEYVVVTNLRNFFNDQLQINIMLTAIMNANDPRCLSLFLRNPWTCPWKSTHQKKIIDQKFTQKMLTCFKYDF
jgi:hypothetical protein